MSQIIIGTETLKLLHMTTIVMEILVEILNLWRHAFILKDHSRLNFIHTNLSFICLAKHS